MFSRRLDEIKNAVLSEAVKVVSFDLFDTLVVRPCIEPTDLFKIVAKRINFNGDFVGIRRMAEQYARKKKVYFHDDVTIYEIYKELQLLTDISQEKADEILNCELEVEYEYIYPRYSIRELYNLAKENGKKVIIVTDVYLPKTFIEKVLEKNDIRDYYRLYVSSEERLAKGSGRLFQKVIAEFMREGIEKESIVHLGDNARSDVAMPKSLGMKSFHLPNAIGILNSKSKFKSLYEFGKRTDSCYLVGSIANYLFDDPYYPFDVDSISGGDSKVFGAVVYGPILLCYTKWLIENSIKDETDKIFFVMRDGYLIERIYQLFAQVYQNVPETDNMYLSRKIRYYFNGKDKNGLINSFEQFVIPEKMTVREFMEKRLLLNEAEKQQVWEIFREAGYPDLDCLMGKPIEYYSVMNKVQKIFADKTKEEIAAIEAYCKDKIGNANRPAFVDVGYRASVSRFIEDRIGIKNIAYQMMATPLNNQYVNRNYDIKSFFSYSFKSVKDMKILHPLTEDVISIQEGTAVKIIKNENEFEIIKSKAEQNATLTAMQEGVMEYVNYTFGALKRDFVDMSFDVTLFWDLLFDFLRNPSSIDVNIIKKMSFEESDFIKIEGDRNIYAQWIEEKIGTNNTNEPLLKQSQMKTIPTENAVHVAVEKQPENSKVEPWEKVSKPHLFAIKVCEKLHILKFAINVKRKIFSKKIAEQQNEEIVNKIFKKPMEDAILQFASMRLADDESPKVLVAGHMTSFDKGTCNYVNQLSSRMDKYEMVLMSECPHLNAERTKQKIIFPFFIVPQFLGKDRYLTETGIKCNSKIKKYVNRKSYLKWGVDNLIKRHADMEQDYAYYLVYYAEQYSNKVLDVIKPEYVILWNEFFAFHHVLKNICQERGIKIVFLEFGSLPGTISIERLGQMGASFPGKYAKEFTKLEVTENELEKAKEVLEFLKDSKLNRNIQPINNNLDDIVKRLKKDRPTILYAGVNDYESGLVPYTTETAESHSPIFKSSEEALVAMEKFAIMHDYNLIYKPHPIIEKQMEVDEKYGDNVILALDIDINDVIDIADVVVTILSQVSYTALIRGKSVIMLGYTQLRGKGCCYEAYKESELDGVMQKAIEEGLTGEMKGSLIRHIAQMNKYNLFDDLQNKPLQYGKSIEKAIEYIFECDDTVQWYLEHDK